MKSLGAKNAQIACGKETIACHVLELVGWHMSGGIDFRWRSLRERQGSTYIPRSHASPGASS